MDIKTGDRVVIIHGDEFRGRFGVIDYIEVEGNAEYEPIHYVNYNVVFDGNLEESHLFKEDEFVKISFDEDNLSNSVKSKNTLIEKNSSFIWKYISNVELRNIFEKIVSEKEKDYYINIKNLKDIIDYEIRKIISEKILALVILEKMEEENKSGE